MIQLTNNLIAILVPDNAYDFEMRRNNQIIYLIRDVINPLSGTEKSEIIDIPNTKYGFVIRDWKIIGTINRSQMFDFNCDRKEYLTLLQSKEINLEELNNQKILIIEKI